MQQRNKLFFLLKNTRLAAIFTIFLSFLFISCDKADNAVAAAGDEILYVQTNNFVNNQNAILAYKNSGDGKLAPIAGSPFLTGGTGLGNPDQILGPADSDNQIFITADKKFLLVTNAGSNSITVFSIQADGSLVAVPGSPFPSGGQTPSSVWASGSYIYVVNKSQDPLHTISMAPNYTALMMDANGKLTPIPGATFETTPGSSPAQALVSRDRKFCLAPISWVLCSALCGAPCVLL